MILRLLSYNSVCTILFAPANKNSIYVKVKDIHLGIDFMIWLVKILEHRSTIFDFEDETTLYFWRIIFIALVFSSYANRRTMNSKFKHLKV